MNKTMHKDLSKLATPDLDVTKIRDAFSSFAKSVVEAAERNKNERERIRGDIRRGARAGKGQFRL